MAPPSRWQSQEREIQNPVSQALYNPRLFCCLQSYCQSNVLEAYTRLRKVAKSFEIGNLPGLWMLCMPLFMILGFLLRRFICRNCWIFYICYPKQMLGDYRRHIMIYQIQFL
ncbi:uncharacterized protein LOC107635169 isoform X2 [Arachis ipaensis]|uniref:uncharacterized protein LOC107635169 isoform X2 n=1 Tax=Arachis ipaensis TaxID=130454 RepID=UPI0007AFB132|nr:uncharacterized protein LOC107635169 isoform X2 [Arachis ipaensis]XP_020977573.1 uncharacterized protein LOC107635169 isoform X2 [Arachis ipaensis]